MIDGRIWIVLCPLCDCPFPFHRYGRASADKVICPLFGQAIGALQAVSRGGTGLWILPQDKAPDDLITVHILRNLKQRSDLSNARRVSSEYAADIRSARDRVWRGNFQVEVCAGCYPRYGEYQEEQSKTEFHRISILQKFSFYTPLGHTPVLAVPGNCAYLLYRKRNL